MSSVADVPRQFISSLESKFSQLTVSLEDGSQQVSHAEQLPVYTPPETVTVTATPSTPPAMPKANIPEPRGRSPGPRSLASRGILRHRASRSGKPKAPQPAALVVQLKKRLRSQSLRANGDDMEIDEGRGRKKAGPSSSVRAGVLVARRKRESGDGGEDADVSCAEAGPSRGSGTPYERHNSALVYWSRRRASSFGERPMWTALSEATVSAPTPSELPPLPTPNASPSARRKRSGRSASTSGLPLPLPLLDTTDRTVRRPSFTMSLMMTPLIQDVDMASPMAPTPIMRTSTESSMWAPRKLNLSVTHGPIGDDETDTDTPPAKSSQPSSPPPPYDSVIRTDDSDGDADDEQTPLRTVPTPSIVVRDASPVPASTSQASTAVATLATVEEEEEPLSGTPKDVNVEKADEHAALDADQDAMIL